MKFKKILEKLDPFEEIRVFRLDERVKRKNARYDDAEMIYKGEAHNIPYYILDMSLFKNKYIVPITMDIDKDTFYLDFYVKGE